MITVNLEYELFIADPAALVLLGNGGRADPALSLLLTGHPQRDKHFHQTLRGQGPVVRLVLRFQAQAEGLEEVWLRSKLLLDTLSDFSIGS